MASYQKFVVHLALKSDTPRVIQGLLYKLLNKTPLTPAEIEFVKRTDGEPAMTFFEHPHHSKLFIRNDGKFPYQRGVYCHLIQTEESLEVIVLGSLKNCPGLLESFMRWFCRYCEYPVAFEHDTDIDPEYNSRIISSCGEGFNVSSSVWDIHDWARHVLSAMPMGTPKPQLNPY